MLNKKRIFFKLLIGFTLLLNAPIALSSSPPVAPFRIAGNLTVNGSWVSEETQALYVIVITSLDKDMSPVCILGIDSVGQGKALYAIDIPFSSVNDGCEAKARNPVSIHIYDGYDALSISKLFLGSDPTPVSSSYYYIGSAGGHERVDIEAVTSPGLGSGAITASDMARAIQETMLNRACEEFDVGPKGVIGLEEAIHALRVVTGQEE